MKLEQIREATNLRDLLNEIDNGIRKLHTLSGEYRISLNVGAEVSVTISGYQINHLGFSNEQQKQKLENFLLEHREMIVTSLVALGVDVPVAPKKPPKKKEEPK